MEQSANKAITINYTIIWKKNTILVNLIIILVMFYAFVHILKNEDCVGLESSNEWWPMLLLIG